MTNTLNEVQLAQIVGAVLKALQTQGAASPKPAQQYRNSFGRFDPIAKDRALLSAFSRRGFKDVVLMDRSDKSKPFNIKPYKAWLAEGRVVRRGERGVKGLFHISQTDVVGATTNAPASPPKMSIPTWRKAAAKAAKAKAKLTPVS
jgi:hypothetical protein